MSAITGCECYQTVVKNISGGTMHFAFLPPHGATLDNNEEYTIPGHPFNTIRITRALQSFCNAIEDGLIEIVHTPSVIGTCGSSSSSSSSSS